MLFLELYPPKAEARGSNPLGCAIIIKVLVDISANCDCGPEAYRKQVIGLATGREGMAAKNPKWMCLIQIGNSLGYGQSMELVYSSTFCRIGLCIKIVAQLEVSETGRLGDCKDLHIGYRGGAISCESPHAFRLSRAGGT